MSTFISSLNIHPKHRMLCHWLNQVIQDNDRNISRLKDFLCNRQGMDDEMIHQVRAFAFQSLYQIANTNGTGLACYMLAQCYEKEWGVSKDEAEAFRWAQLSTQAGNPWGTQALGLYHSLAIGTPKDLKTGFEYVKKAANQGHPHSLFNLGVMYEQGEGVDKDVKKAFECYEKSSTAGNPFAMSCLGLCYETGVGCAMSLEKAFFWHKLAAEHNNPTSMNTLGYFYEVGLGCQPDLNQAIYWYLRSTKAGETEFSQQNLQRLREISKFGPMIKKMIDRTEKLVIKEAEQRAMIPELLRVMLIGFFKEPECVFFRDRIPFEIFLLIMETAQLINCSN